MKVTLTAKEIASLVSQTFLYAIALNSPAFCLHKEWCILSADLSQIRYTKGFFFFLFSVQLIQPTAHCSQSVNHGPGETRVYSMMMSNKSA